MKVHLWMPSPGLGVALACNITKKVSQNYHISHNTTCAPNKNSKSQPNLLPGLNLTWSTSSWNLSCHFVCFSGDEGETKNLKSMPCPLPRLRMPHSIKVCPTYSHIICANKDGAGRANPVWHRNLGSKEDKIIQQHQCPLSGGGETSFSSRLLPHPTLLCFRAVRN